MLLTSERLHGQRPLAGWHVNHALTCGCTASDRSRDGSELSRSHLPHQGRHQPGEFAPAPFFIEPQKRRHTRDLTTQQKRSPRDRWRANTAEHQIGSESFPVTPFLRRREGKKARDGALLQCTAARRPPTPHCSQMPPTAAQTHYFERRLELPPPLGARHGDAARRRRVRQRSRRRAVHCGRRRA